MICCARDSYDLSTYEKKSVRGHHGRWHWQSVLAHELGHFKHRHIGQRMLWQAGLTLIGLATLGWLMQQDAFYLGLGVLPHLDGSNQALALVLVMLVVLVSSLTQTKFPM